MTTKIIISAIAGLVAAATIATAAQANGHGYNGGHDGRGYTQASGYSHGYGHQTFRHHSGYGHGGYDYTTTTPPGPECWIVIEKHGYDVRRVKVCKPVVEKVIEKEVVVVEPPVTVVEKKVVIVPPPEKRVEKTIVETPPVKIVERSVETIRAKKVTEKVTTESPAGETPAAIVEKPADELK